MSVVVNVKFDPSLDQLAKEFGDFSAKQALQDEINKILFSIESLSKQLTPVSTGRLRSSETTSPANDSLQGILSTNVDYAIYVHEGTRYMRPRPFMETAAKFVIPQIEGKISNRLDAELVKAFKKL